MDNLNYRFPFNPLAVMKDSGSMETCDVAESIAQNIMLLIITKREKTAMMKIMEMRFGE